MTKNITKKEFLRAGKAALNTFLRLKEYTTPPSVHIENNGRNGVIARFRLFSYDDTDYDMSFGGSFGSITEKNKTKFIKFAAEKESQLFLLTFETNKSDITTQFLPVYDRKNGCRGGARRFIEDKNMWLIITTSGLISDADEFYICLIHYYLNEDGFTEFLGKIREKNVIPNPYLEEEIWGDAVVEFEHQLKAL